MTAPIDRAFVEILPDLKRFHQETKAGIEKSMSGIKSSVGGTAKQIESGFHGAGASAGRSMRGVGTSIRSATREGEGAFARLKGAGKEAFSALGGGKIAGLFAVGGIIEFGKKSTETYETIGKETLKLQRVMGGSVRQAGEWRGAMQLGGVSADQFAIAIRKMSQEVVKGSTGKGAFPALGIAVKDAHGRLKPLGELLPQISDKFRAMAPGAVKNALAVQLFGRSGLQMLPFLNRGSSGMEALRKKAEELGIVLGDKDVNAIKKSIAAHRESTAAWQGFQIMIGRDVLPVLDKFIEVTTKYVVPAVKVAFRAIGVAILWLRDHVIAPVQAWISDHWPQISRVFRAVGKQIKGMVDAVIPLLRSLWKGILEPIFNFIHDHWSQISAVVKVVSAIFVLSILFMINEIKVLARILTWLITHIIAPIFRGILAVITFNIRASIAIFRTFQRIWNAVVSAIGAIWRHVGAPVFTAVGAAVRAVWSRVISPVFAAIRRGWNGLWRGLGSAFTSIWGGVQRGIRNGLQAVVNVVNFFIRGINTILRHLPGGYQIQQIILGGAASASGPRSGSGRGRAYKSGGVRGVLPGYSPGVDTIAIPHDWFSGGEGILTPEATRALGGKRFVDAVNARFSGRSGTQPSGHHFLGGIIGKIGEVIGNSAKFVEDALRKGVAGVLRAGLNIAEAPVKFLISRIPQGLVHALAGGGFEAIDRGIRGLINALGGKARKTAAAAAANVGPIPVGQHKALIDQALSLARVMISTANESAVNTIVTFESGWNPNAINLTDSNARAGHPSQGLMQTIPSTFEAYRLGSLPDVITNPLANLVAGIRYAVANYGSLQNVPGVAGIRRGGRYVGYRDGAWNIDHDQFAMLHRREMVLPVPAADKFRQGATVDPRELAAAVADALAGAEFRFDPDGFVRLVIKRQNVNAIKGVRR